MMDWFRVILPLASGSTVGLLTQRNTQWYDTLAKPAWAPPKQVYGPVWTILYICLGIASTYLPDALMPWYYLHLALNLSWTPVFFGLKKPRAALAIISLMLATIGYIVYQTDNSTVRALLAPYIAWLLFAGALNAHIASI